jgi:hypothetical protein
MEGNLQIAGCVAEDKRPLRGAVHVTGGDKLGVTLDRVMRGFDFGELHHGR